MLHHRILRSLSAAALVAISAPAQPAPQIALKQMPPSTFNVAEIRDIEVKRGSTASELLVFLAARRLLSVVIPSNAASSVSYPVLEPVAGLDVTPNTGLWVLGGPQARIPISIAGITGALGVQPVFALPLTSGTGQLSLPLSFPRGLPAGATLGLQPFCSYSVSAAGAHPDPVLGGAGSIQVR